MARNATSPAPAPSAAAPVMSAKERRALKKSGQTGAEDGSTAAQASSTKITTLEEDLDVTPIPSEIIAGLREVDGLAELDDETADQLAWAIFAIGSLNTTCARHWSTGLRQLVLDYAASHAHDEACGAAIKSSRASMTKAGRASLHTAVGVAMSDFLIPFAAKTTNEPLATRLLLVHLHQVSLRCRAADEPNKLLDVVEEVRNSIDDRTQLMTAVVLDAFADNWEALVEGVSTLRELAKKWSEDQAGVRAAFINFLDAFADPESE